jgi:hypothetical protein
MVVYVCNPSIQEAEVGGLRIWGHPELHSKTLPQKKITLLWELLSRMMTLSLILQTPSLTCWILVLGCLFPLPGKTSFYVNECTRFQRYNVCSSGYNCNLPASRNEILIKKSEAPVNCCKDIWGRMRGPLKPHHDLNMWLKSKRLNCAQMVHTWGTVSVSFIYKSVVQV